jgi:hypothetical protein
VEQIYVERLVQNMVVSSNLAMKDAVIAIYKNIAEVNKIAELANGTI